MSTAPAVSVLVPCHNAEAYLGDTLESVLRQTLRAGEILVVDDASTDGSRAVAERFAPAVTVLVNSGQGASAARNHASRAARGEFFQYLDADDLLEPQALASRVEALERSGADVAISDWQRLEETGGRWEPRGVESGRLPGSAAPADLKIFKGFWAPPAAILYRRSLCERIGGWHEHLPVIQDARFLLDAATVGGQFTHVPGVGARYRQHRSNSLSSRNAARFWHDVLRNSLEVEERWRQAGRLDAEHLNALAGAYGHCAHVGFSEDRQLFEAAWSELRRFPGQPKSNLVRVGRILTSVAGYRAARAVLLPLRRGSRA